MELKKVEGYKIISVKLSTIKQHKDTIEPLCPDWINDVKNCGGYSVEYEFTGAKAKESKWCIIKIIVKDTNNLKVKARINTAKLEVVGKEEDLMIPEFRMVS